ncbi:MAG: hypothetical protein CL932_15205 [Deltaproteobacteria bacterium]|nr:hypothetical protein [Deltaproteobacteria bacterium]|tara:strand:- start:2098 stop:4059 length:1962 start_codon:yes stop_codon:yes gene_type:complete
MSTQESKQLGKIVKTYRERLSLSQEQAAKMAGINRSVVAHLEQGLRLPKVKRIEALCKALEIPAEYWHAFTLPDSSERFAFEDILSELVGRKVHLTYHDESVQEAAQQLINKLIDEHSSDRQTHDLFNSVLVFYGVQPTSWPFFAHYLGASAFDNLLSFEHAIRSYQKDAIRLYSTLSQAYKALNASQNLMASLAPLQPNSLISYERRAPWDVIQEVGDEQLPDLGYIAAARVQQEEAERQALKTFLEDLAKQLREEGPTAISQIKEKTRRRMDSFLRKFDSTLQHGPFSPLFAPDADELVREAQRLAPKSEEELARMAETQNIALQNLAHYLSADYMDVYVATSMRNDADFVSVNQFVRTLFSHNQIEPLKLRYFNPTQSWLDDRIGKGLVEALMLKRSQATIYMAQKSDTFGKDSEASIALGQGKPVIVYVPKLSIPQADIDSEALSLKTRSELELELRKEVGEEQLDLDASIDDEALVARILLHRLKKVPERDLHMAIKQHWADFDLYGEAHRITDEDERAQYRQWLDQLIKQQLEVLCPTGIREHLHGLLVAVALRFERRARVFREIHPLAVQVILSSGVLNGILVVRSVDQCADILRSLIENKLSLTLEQDSQNIRLVEETTGSTIRVISRHQLLRNAFETFYKEYNQ